MATADHGIINDKLNLEIAPTIPLDRIEAVFVELGFDSQDIKKRKYIANQAGNVDALIMDLLSSWKVQGCGLEAAEKLKDAMAKCNIDRAVNLIQAAINAVIPPPPTADLLTDDDPPMIQLEEPRSRPLQMATDGDEIITDKLNLEIAPTIPLNKIEAVFVDLGFDIQDIKKRRYIANQAGNVDDLIMDLLSSWKARGCGLKAAKKLEDAMIKCGIEKAVKMIQAAISDLPMDDDALPDVPSDGLPGGPPDGSRDVPDYIS